MDTMAARPLELKAVDVTRREIEGYASVFGVVDLQGDIVAPGAFARTLAERGPAGVDVHINHDMTKLPVGTPLEIREDERGLFTRTKIFGTVEGDGLLSMAAELMALDRPMGLSIGYTTRRAERASGYGAGAGWRRKLLDVDLREYSFTTRPANQQATVSGIKRALPTVDDHRTELGELERYLTDQRWQEQQTQVAARERARETLYALSTPLERMTLEDSEARGRVLASLKSFDPQTDWAARCPAPVASVTVTPEQQAREAKAIDVELERKIDQAETKRIYDHDFRRRWDAAHPGGMDRCRCRGHRLRRRELVG